MLTKPGRRSGSISGNSRKNILLPKMLPLRRPSFVSMTKITRYIFTDILSPNQCATNQFSPTPMPVSIFTAIGMAFFMMSATRSRNNSISSRWASKTSSS